MREGRAAHSSCAVFGPDVVKEMSDAFDLAWTAMLARNQACAIESSQAKTRQHLAFAIIEFARQGRRGANELSACALRRLCPPGLDGKAAHQTSPS